MEKGFSRVERPGEVSNLCLADQQTIKASLRSLVYRILTLFEFWIRNYTSRRKLRMLDNTSLHDIGIGRYAAEQEARKPFWRK